MRQFVNNIYVLIFVPILLIGTSKLNAQIKGIPSSVVSFGERSFEDAKPWVVWYFMHASYSKEGIKADLKAMADQQIAGAYFTPIKDKTSPPLFDTVTETLSPEWWDMFKYLVEQAKLYNIQIAMFPNDGFATAGGPWITPAKSMQKVVYADTTVNSKGDHESLRIQLPRPTINEGYYQDIKLFAIPIKHVLQTSLSIKPKVTSSYKENLDRLAKKGNKEAFGTGEPGWIQYEFDQLFTCNALKIEWSASNYQVNRMKVLVSNDGEEFKEIEQLKSPRMGWLDWDNGVTHTIPQTKAKYFRFVYDPKGSQPGAEDLDVAKWKPSLKLLGITLLEEPKINQYEGKTGEIWRVSLATPENYVGSESLISKESIRLLNPPDEKGTIDLRLPKGTWRILRVGHTSTGHKNETAGAAKGLECDKLDADIVAYQFEQWYGMAKKAVGPELSRDVLTVYHIDSWESGSQNWTARMAEEFQKRRGYDLTPFLPVLAGYVVGSVNESEAFLHDYRQTIADLLQEKGFQTLRNKATEYGVDFTAETTAPVMTSDGLIHFSLTDRTMGEFWYRSPSHDKPNDILDAISGGHIYGKNIVMSEAFTQIRMQWDEHPRLLKSLQDRNYALGVNNLVYHVYVHNPWMDRKPGMTLDGVGTYFQRDQIWWKPAKVWVDYGIRSQQLLQHGKPVRDVAVFIGEEIPRRSLLPDRLTDVLPGIIGEHRVQRTKKYLENEGQPLQKVASVTTSANMYNPEDWVDPLQGYAYDSFNPDALLNKSVVVGNKVVFSDNIAYDVLVVPDCHLLNPNCGQISVAVLEKFSSLIHQGARVIFQAKPHKIIGKVSAADSAKFNHLLIDLFQNMQKDATGQYKKVGKGEIYLGAYQESSFDKLGIQKDVIVGSGNNESIAWNHRTFKGGDSYFLSNQDSVTRKHSLSFRTSSPYCYLYDAQADRLTPLAYSQKDGRTIIELSFLEHQAFFVLFSDNQVELPVWNPVEPVPLSGQWELELDGVDLDPLSFKEPLFWTSVLQGEHRYHSGTGTYSTQFMLDELKADQRLSLRLDQLECMAEVTLNGTPQGVIWAKPFEIDLKTGLKVGENKLEIKVYNTWGNRFGYEREVEVAAPQVKTTAPSKFLKEMQPAGLQGKVEIVRYGQGN